jgi:hypothetical protein
MRDPNTPQVFVSYSRTDRLQCALDPCKRCLRPRVSPSTAISTISRAVRIGGVSSRQRFAGVEHVVLVLSPAALRSAYVARGDESCGCDQVSALVTASKVRCSGDPPGQARTRRGR